MIYLDCQGCPFCGVNRYRMRIRFLTRVVKSKGQRRNVPCYRVLCLKCRALGPRKATERAAVKAWDLRAV